MTSARRADALRRRAEFQNFTKIGGVKGRRPIYANYSLTLEVHIQQSGDD